MTIRDIVRKSCSVYVCVCVCVRHVFIMLLSNIPIRGYFCVYIVVCDLFLLGGFLWGGGEECLCVFRNTGMVMISM